MMAFLPLLLTSTEEYGKVGLLVSIEIIVSNASLMGMDRAVLRFYHNDESPKKLLKSILLIWAALSWIPLTTALGLFFVGRETVFGIPLFPHLFLLGASVAVLNLNVLCISIGRSKRQLTIFLRFRLGYVCLKFVGVVIMATLLGHSLSYAAGIGIASVAMLVFIVPFLRAKADGPTDSAVVSRLLIFGWPLVFHVLSGNIFDHFSRFFLVFYGTTAEVGVFTFAFTLGSALYIMYAILTTYFEPRIYSHADDSARCERWLSLYSNACVVLASFGAAILIFLFPYISALFGPDYDDARVLIPIIMGGVLLRPIYLQGNYRLTACTKTGLIAGTSFVSAILSLGLNFLLIPSHGMWGAAVAMYVTHFFLATCMLAISFRVAKVPLRQQSAWITFATCATGSLMVVVAADNSGIAIVALIVTGVICCGLLLKSAKEQLEKRT
jgi:O-antigen/teichoic acid export membrane protein